MKYLEVATFYTIKLITIIVIAYILQFTSYMSIWIQIPIIVLFIGFLFLKNRSPEYYLSTFNRKYIFNSGYLVIVSYFIRFIYLTLLIYTVYLQLFTVLIALFVIEAIVMIVFDITLSETIMLNRVTRKD